MSSTRSIVGGHAEALEALEQLESGFVALDADDRYTYVNAAAALLLGRTPDELLGRRVFDVFPEVGGSPMQGAMHRARATGRMARVQDYSQALDRWFEVRVHPHAGGLRVFFDDITARVRLEESLRGCADLVERIGLGLGILHLDDDGALRVRSANEALGRILGVSAASLVGQGVGPGHVLALGLELDAVSRQVLRSGSPLDLGERTWTGPGGSRVLRVRVVPMDGGDVGVAVEDVTDFRTAFGDRLEMAARLLGASEHERHALGAALAGPMESLLATALRAGSAATTSSDAAIRSDLAAIEAEVQASVAALLGLLADRYPPQLEDGGLGVALPVLGAASGVRIAVHGEADGIGGVVRDAAYRVVREAAQSVDGADVLHVTLDGDGTGSLSVTVRAPGGRLTDATPSGEITDWVHLLGGTAVEHDDDDVLVSVHLPGAP